MDFRVTGDGLQPQYKEILSVLWKKMVNFETFEKRRLVARNQLSASFGMGSLQIHPENTAEGLQINLIQKYHQKFEQDNLTTFTQLLGGLLH
jgi:hypothetical protein